MTPRPIVPISVLQNTDRPYKVYTFKFTQSGGLDPTVVVHENTIGNIVWTRTSAGAYVGTLVGAFPLAKTYFNILDPLVPTYLYSDSSGNIEIQLATTTDTVSISTYSGLNFLDGVFTTPGVPFEIRVYP